MEGDRPLELVPRGGTQEVTNVDGPPVQDCPANDHPAAERKDFAEPMPRRELAVPGHDAEAIAFDLEDHRVPRLAEAGGGTSNGGENGAGAGRYATGGAHGTP